MNSLTHTIIRLLTFRLSPEGYANLGRPALAAGLIGTWLVGMGRYWDNPKAEFLQKLGLGSVVYIFVLAALLWLIVLPLRVEGWRYERVLTFVSLTSFPAILYAIPVEMWVGVDRANHINAVCLVAVVAWRSGLLVDFLRKNTDLNRWEMTAVMLLPFAGIATILSILNLEYANLRITTGAAWECTEYDETYSVLLLITGISLVLLPIALLIYLGSIWYRWKKRKQL